MEDKRYKSDLSMLARNKKQIVYDIGRNRPKLLLTKSLVIFDSPLDFFVDTKNKWNKSYSFLMISLYVHCVLTKGKFMTRRIFDYIIYVIVNLWKEMKNRFDLPTFYTNLEILSAFFCMESQQD